MSTEPNTVNETAENPIELVKASRKAFVRLLILSGTGLILFFLGQQTFTPILSFSGLLIFALPLVLSLCFGFGGIIDIGPVFTAIDTPIGNVIYRTMVPDIGGQMAANLALTLIRAILMFFLSVFLMPFLLIICFIGYKIARAKALKYAKENGIDKKEVPFISAIVIPIYIALIILSIVIGNAIHSATSKKYLAEYDEYLAEIAEEVYDPFVENLDAAVPEEYFADAYKGDSYTGGYVAEFSVDGKTVLCGRVKELEGYPDLLDSSSTYFIIDGVVYIDRYGTEKYEKCEDEDVIKLLKNRYVDAHLGEGMELSDAITGDDYLNDAMKNAIMYLEVNYKDERHYLHFDEDNNLIGYGLYVTSGDMIETQFVFNESSKLDSLKASAEKIIDGSAEIE